jgi:hypothetical protein
MKWEYLLILLAIVVIWFLRDPKPTPKTFVEPDKLPLPKRVLECPDFTAQIINLPPRQAIAALRLKAREAQRIVPSFPNFPLIVLSSPADKGKYASKGERIMIETLEMIFPGKKFEKVRPTWLRNPVTNRCLELDGYNEELCIAAEYNGIQHYVYPNFTRMSEEEFLAQRERDIVKEVCCKSKNICLIRIPYTVPLEKIPLAVYAKLLDAVPGISPQLISDPRIKQN